MRETESQQTFIGKWCVRTWVNLLVVHIWRPAYVHRTDERMSDQVPSISILSIQYTQYTPTVMYQLLWHQINCIKRNSSPHFLARRCVSVFIPTGFQCNAKIRIWNLNSTFNGQGWFSQGQGHPQLRANTFF